MRSCHRRPLVAYGLVSIACAVVLLQPSTSMFAGGLADAPVVKLLRQNGLDAQQALSSAFGFDNPIAQSAAPTGEGPNEDVDVVEPGDDVDVSADAPSSGGFLD